MNEINPKERLEAVLRFEEPDDRVPVTVGGSCSPYQITGISFEESMFRPDLCVKCTEKFQEIFPENDVMSAGAPGTLVSAWAAMGAEAAILSTGWFDVTKPGVKNMAELEELDFNEILKKRFLESKMFTTGIEAAEVISKKYGKEFLILAGFEAGFTAAGRIVGTEEEMLLLIDEPEFVHKLADFMNRLWIEGAEKFANAGVNMIETYDPNAMTILISPKTYREFACPLEKEMAEAVKKLGCYYHLHICGNALPILDGIAETGCNVYSFDQMTDITEAKRRIGGKVVLWGNVDPARMLLGTPEEVMELSRECIRIAAPGGGFVLGPGCDTAKMTPRENFRAMCEAAVKYGQYPISL